MRRALSPAIGLVLSFLLVSGCSLLKKKKDAGTTDEPPIGNAPTTTVGGTGAKNEKDVLRYTNETAIADEPATIGKDVTKARTFPATGAEVATLSKGTAIVKKAKFFSTGVLVIFDDPATADGTKLLGWIPPEAIAPPSATPTPTPAFIQPRVVVDAGIKPAVADAGVATVDAGPAAPTALLQVLPTAGKCPAGFALFGPFCRRPCNADADCPKPAVCTLGAGPKKTCSATR